MLNDRFEKGAPSFERIDRACAQCHQQHDFHEPNVITNRSCSACHKEHQGLHALMAVVNLDCASCHNNSAIMQASAERGKQLPRHAFSSESEAGELPRKSFCNFRGRPMATQRPSPHSAKVIRHFNCSAKMCATMMCCVSIMQRHLNSSDIPPTKAGKLDCNYCHQARTERPLHAADQFRGALPGMSFAAVRCDAIRISNYRTATRNWSAHFCARCPRNMPSWRDANAA